MSDDERYNGWRNHETWCVNRWLDNEESSDRSWRDQAKHIWHRACADATFSRREIATHTLAEALKEELTEAIPELTGLWQDLLVGSLSAVDWHEIADGMLDALPDDETAELAEDD
jgi:hypothetical protein